ARAFLRGRRLGRVAGVQALGAKQTEAGPAGSRDRSLVLQLAEHAPGHLPAGTDEPGQVRAREDRRVAEEEVPVPREDADHPTARVLVQEAVHLVREVVENRGQAIGDIQFKTGIPPSQSTPVLPAPGGTLN